jgi:hypothetical protein
MRTKLTILALVMVCFGALAKADSTATAEASIDWAGATFSSPVSPGGFSNNTFSTLVQASGLVLYPVRDNSSGKSQSAFDLGWAPTTATENYSPGNVSTASTSATTVDAIATNTVGAVGMGMFAQAERAGIVWTSNGSIVISLPYTLTFTATNDGPSCCSLMFSQVWITLWNGTQEVPGVGGGAIHLGSQPFSQSGTLVLDATGLAPGQYSFDVGAASGSTFVPEPGTLGLVGIGFVLIWRRLKSKS